MHLVNCGPRVRGQASRGLGEPGELFAGTDFSVIINSYQCFPETRRGFMGVTETGVSHCVPARRLRPRWELDPCFVPSDQ